MKIIHTAWFSGIKCIGIVVIENEIGEKKAYIGIGDGQNEKFDAEKIAAYGIKMLKESLKEILSKLE